MEVKRRRNRKTIFIIVGVVAVVEVVLVAMLTMFLLGRRDPGNRVAKLLDAGQKYIMDEDFENAIATYDEVLAIEPKNKDAIEGEVTAYVSWSDALIEQGNYEKAASILQEATGKFEDERLTIAQSKIKSATVTVDDSAVNDYAAQLAALCEAGDYEGAGKLLTETASVWRALWQKESKPSIFTNVEAKTLGIYYGGRYLYYGDYSGESRQGNGLWVTCSEGVKNGPMYRYVIGEWSDDMPNGQQEEHFIITPEYINMNPDVSGTQEMCLKRTGSAVNGLCNGTWTFEWGDGRQNKNEFVNGKMNYDDAHFAEDESAMEDFISLKYQIKGVSEILGTQAIYGVPGFPPDEQAWALYYATQSAGDEAITDNSSSSKIPEQMGWNLGGEGVVVKRTGEREITVSGKLVYFGSGADSKEITVDNMVLPLADEFKMTSHSDYSVYENKPEYLWKNLQLENIGDVQTEYEILGLHNIYVLEGEMYFDYTAQ